MRVTEFANWKGCQAPELPSVKGEHVRIDPARLPEDADALFEALGGLGNDDLWRYIPIGPFEDAESLSEGLQAAIARGSWLTHLIRDAASNDLLGMASYMRLRPQAGSVEVGCIMFSKTLQRTPAATEAMFLMARYVFDELGYRRYEWKCDNANEASKSAALRLGFQFEGIFRQDMVMKGRSRDTAWFSIIDKEWPKAKAALETWLAPENYGAAGRQRRSLAEIRSSL